MVAVALRIPRTIRRYPDITPGERNALLGWVQDAPARVLLRALADPDTEGKLIALRSDEPLLANNLKRHGRAGGGARGRRRLAGTGEHSALLKRCWRTALCG